MSDFDDDDDAIEEPIELDLYNQSNAEISHEIENFKKLLKADELKLFAVVQRKFDEFLREEITRIHHSHESELKIVMDQLESEKVRSEANLSNLRAELETKHKNEMEELRTYFEKKCSEMEKQYSEEVFSQHSRRHSLDTGSDISDQDNLPEEVGGGGTGTPTPKHTKTALLNSPTHRKLTPTSLEKRSPSKRVKRGVKTPDSTDEKVSPTFSKLKLQFLKSFFSSGYGPQYGPIKIFLQ